MGRHTLWGLAVYYNGEGGFVAVSGVLIMGRQTLWGLAVYYNGEGGFV